MPERDKSTLGLALFVSAFGALAAVIPWIIIPVLLTSVFLLEWGRDSQGTEKAISNATKTTYLPMTSRSFLVTPAWEADALLETSRTGNAHNRRLRRDRPGNKCHGPA